MTILRLGELFAPLPDAATARDLRLGERLFRQGDDCRAIYELEHGEVRLVRHGAEGREITLHRPRPGESFAEAALFSDHYHCDAVADRPSRVIAYPKAAVLAAIAANPERGLRLMAHLARQVQALRTRIELHNIRSARERLVQYLLLRLPGDGGAVAVPGTLKQLAAELGLTHEALYRALAALEADGIVARRPPGCLTLTLPPGATPAKPLKT